MARGIDRDRRSFLGSAALSAAALRLGVVGRGTARTGTATAPPLEAARSIDAGALRVGYAELGPPSGTPVLLLHGWPYDIQSYGEVAPALASQGYRVIVPYVRGYGSTRFRSDAAVRNGEP